MQTASDITCPICGLEHIRPDKVHCPHCDANLACFRVLDAIPDELPAPKQEKKPQPVAASVMIILLGIIMIMAVIQLYRLSRLETIIEAGKTLCADVKTDRPAGVKLGPLTSGEAAPRPVKTPAVPPKTDRKPPADSAKPAEHPATSPDETAASPATPPESPEPAPAEPSGPGPAAPEPDATPAADADFVSYTAQSGDTLWQIAVNFYGSGFLYPVLLEHNPNIGIYEVSAGTTIRALKDRQAARRIYNRLIARDGGRVYWQYTVSQGDTLRSVARRFYGSERETDRILNMNPDLRMIPGAKIKILLM